MNKPDWKDAPEWARWLAMDADGEWFFYEEKPSLGVKVWYPNGARPVSRLASPPASEKWKNSLEERPK